MLAGRALKCAFRAFLGESPLVRQRARRAIAWHFLGTYKKELTFQRNGFVWTGSTDDDIAQSIFIDGRYQDKYIDAIAGWMDPARSTIVNVGANIGDVALPLTRMGKHVIAIEPNPSTFARLLRNVKRNRLEEAVSCREAAISDTVGTVTLEVPFSASNSSIVSASGESSHAESGPASLVQVPATSLDELLASLSIPPGQVALVWSDTEGFETRVIRSGSSLWDNGAPLWVEVWPEGLARHGGVDAFLAVCAAYFESVVDSRDFEAGPLPISGLTSIVRSLGSGLFTDVLLLP